MAKKFNTLDAPLKVRTSAALDPNHGDFHTGDLETLSSNADTDVFVVDDANGRSYQTPRSAQHTGWTDYLTSISSGKVGAANTPTWSAFGPSGNLFAYSFGVDDYIMLAGFHANHDIKQGSKVYPHCHWCTDGTDTGVVDWELEYTFAKGHDQEAFPAPTVVTVSQAASGTAWQHMIAEVSVGDAFTAPEVDSLVLMRLKRASSSPTNGDTVFGLFVDLHVEIERAGTLNKSPSFYV